jgi:environmental stress-induced protein Ves
MQLIPLPFSQYRQVSWRNGSGSARDIAVHPAGAGMSERFGWRVTLAEIDRDGPFSVYEPEIERVITLLDGAGFDLEFDAAPGISLAEQHMPARFRGHWQADCRLKGARCIVFNILYDDRAFSSQTHIIRPGVDQPMVFSPPGRQSILFCLNGRFEIKAAEQSEQQSTSGSGAHPVQLMPWDSLQIDLDADETPLLTMTASIAESSLLLIGFDALDGAAVPADQDLPDPAMSEELARTA